ncbi:MAG TPA: hypothetical protein VF212_16170 [Longimicrobiales bacterium]
MAATTLDALPGAAADTARAAKFRQAAFTYLHVGILYEAAAYVFWKEGILPTDRGPAWLWLAIGPVITGIIVWGIGFRRSVWFTRAIWAIHALRLPAMIGGAFFPDPDSALSPAFFLTALLVVVVNLWMLARAGWDL